MLVAAKSQHQRVWHVELRQDSRAPPPCLLTSADTQSARSLHYANALRNESQLLLAGAAEIAGDLEEGDDLNVFRKRLKRRHLLHVHRSAGNEPGQRVSTGSRQPRQPRLRSS